MITFLFSLFCFSVLYLYYRHLKSQPTIPKGLKEIPLEKGFPLLGIIPQIEPPLANYLMKLSQKHGPLYQIKMGLRNIVILNNFEVVKKCFKENGYNFSGRGKFLFLEKIANDSGIVFIDGEKWVKQRSFVLSVLRDFGFGREKSQEAIQCECYYLIDELKSLDGRCVDFAYLIPIYMANIISKVVLNKRFLREDPKFNFILKIILENSRGKDFLSLILLMFPFLDYSKVFNKYIMTITSRWKRFNKGQLIFQEEVEEHKKRLDLNSEGEDLMDRYLIKQNKLRLKTGDVGTFTDMQIAQSSIELFAAGYETTTTLLIWTFFFMCRFPDIQEKVYLEITDNIGNERMATMNDRKSLHYTQAVMDEVMRLSSILPLALDHKTFTDSNIDGYFIPKDSVIFPNILACHMDPKTWKNPMEFKPDRFLSTDNNGELKYNPREELILFSIGKRQCLGESLARMQYFIFFITILQKFKVSTSEIISEKTYEEIVLGKDGIIRCPKIKDFIFSYRYKRGERNDSI